ncbi:MAG: S8 family serine peptidase [Promethearchaeota archaeon]
MTTQQLILAESLGVRFERRGDSVIGVGRIYSARVSDTASLNALSAIGLVRATSGEKQYYPALQSSVATMGAPDVWEYLQKDGSSINGSGVTVAVVDLGVEWTHPSLWRQTEGPYDVIMDSGDYYVDINGNALPDTGEGPINHIDRPPVDSLIDIAEDYMFIDTGDDSLFELDEGDCWLGGVDSNTNGRVDLPTEDAVLFGEPKVRVLFDQENNDVYVRGVNLTSQADQVGDPDGHGTHIASTIAGGQLGYTSFLGVAPGADLLVVKSQLRSSDILDAIHFAVENGADIINMSFSSYVGFLDGTDLEDLAVSEAFLKYGTVSTVAAGNLGSRPKHAHFDVGPGTNTSAVLKVSSLPDASLLSFLWHSDNQDEHVFLKPPSGDTIDLGTFSSLVGSSQVIETPNLFAYAFADESLRGMNNLIIQISEDDHNWTDGNWDIGIVNPSGDTVTVDIYAWDGNWHFSDFEFMSHIDYSKTISAPGTADLAVTVANYNEGTSNIDSGSSRGPRIDGTKKITVAAPGASIVAASSNIQSLWISRTGTSMAAPHVAGLLALIRQASSGVSGWSDFTALTAGTGGPASDQPPPSHQSPPLDNWGYGLVDSVWAVRHVLDLPLVAGTTIEDWFGIEDVLSSPEDLAVDAGLDILNVKPYQAATEIGLAVTSRGNPDYSAANVLSIHLDWDENAVTGRNGYETLVNVTSGVATVYEWEGGSYSPSSLSVDWWMDNVTLFLRLDKSNPSKRGYVSVSTSNSTMSPIDQTGSTLLLNQWRPIVENLTVEPSEDSFDVSIEVSDRDDMPANLSIAWSVVDGSLGLMDSGVSVGTNSTSFQYDVAMEDYEFIHSVLFNVSDADYWSILPPVMLSQTLTYLRIVSATLDSHVVRVGLFVTEHVTGEVVVEGYTLAQAVYISFQTAGALPLNLSLAGTLGIYEIDISPAALAAGEYEVYAAAVSQLGAAVELHMGTLQIVEDNSMVVILGLGIGALIVVIYFAPRLRAGKRGDAMD